MKETQKRYEQPKNHMGLIIMTKWVHKESVTFIAIVQAHHQQGLHTRENMLFSCN